MVEVQRTLDEVHQDAEATVCEADGQCSSSYVVVVAGGSRRYFFFKKIRQIIFCEASSREEIGGGAEAEILVRESDLSLDVANVNNKNGCYWMGGS